MSTSAAITAAVGAANTTHFGSSVARNVAKLDRLDAGERSAGLIEGSMRRWGAGQSESVS